MRNALLGLAALMMTGSAQAAVQIGFTSPVGNVGSNSHTYSNGGYSVTAYGYSNYNFSNSTGTANNLYDKTAGGDETGLGLLSDPSGDHEIWYGGANSTPAVVLDVSSLLGVASAAQFMMGSTTANEQWILEGFNGTSWSQLLTGTTEGNWINFTGWGSYSEYAFVSGGTVDRYGHHTAGNVLLSAISLTPAVPEPGTWAMMLLGFGGIGFAVRRRKARETALRLA